MKRKRRIIQDQQVVKLAREFLKSKISAAGVSYVVTSKSKFRRYVWIIVLLCTATVMSFMTYKVVSEYLKYPKTVIKEDTIQPRLYFPAVTVCPLNPISATNLEKTSAGRLAKLKKMLQGSKDSSVRNDVREECYSNPMCRWSWFTEQCGCVISPCSTEFCIDDSDENCTCALNMCDTRELASSGACTFEKETCYCKMNFKYSKAGEGGNASDCVREVAMSLQDNDVRELITLIEESETPDLTSVSEDLIPTLKEMYNFGTDFDRIVTSCSYEGMYCDKENFTLVFHPKYGKCYMFNYVGGNPQDIGDVLKIHNYGSASGLNLLLQADFADAVELLARELGVRIVIHNAQELPFVSEHGFNIRIGDMTAVEVTMDIVRRIGPPWGTCTSDSSQLPFVYNDRPYNQLGCQKRCRHHYSQKICDCTKRSFISAKIVQGSFDSTLRFCNSANESQVNCVSGILNKIQKGELKCNCNPSCWEKFYGTSLSTSSLNTEYYRMVKAVKTLKLQGNVTSRSNRVQRSAMVGLKVYYKTLQVSIFEEIPSYSWETLVANIGGNLGFFMGLSVVTFVEVFEFIWDIIFSAFKCGRSGSNKIMVDSSENARTVDQFKRENDFFSEIFHRVRQKDPELGQNRVSEAPVRMAIANGMDNLVDVYTVPRTGRGSRRVYGVPSTSLSKRRLFRRRILPKRKRSDSLSSSTPYSE